MAKLIGSFLREYNLNHAHLVKSWLKEFVSHVTILVPNALESMKMIVWLASLELLTIQAIAFALKLANTSNKMATVEKDANPPLVQPLTPDAITLALI